MIIDNVIRQHVYDQLLRATNKRLEQTVPGSDGSYIHLSLGRTLNVLFLLRGEFGSLGDYVTTLQALRTLVGDELLWAEPQKSSPPTPVELVQ